MRLLTAKDVSEGLRVPLARVYELARTGVLPVVRLGDRQIRFDEDALREWIAHGGNATEKNSSDAETQ
jgi:excisionase family DNA binding protein